MRLFGARGAVALGAALLAASAAAGHARAEPLSLLAATGLRVDFAPLHPAAPDPDERDAVVPQPPPAAARRWLSLTGSASPGSATDLATLLERGERWRLVRVGAVADARPLAARMSLFGEIPYLADETTIGVPGPGDTYELASVGVKAESRGFEAGAVYRSVEARPERFVRAASRPSRRGPEVWVAHRAGPVRLRVARSSLSDNVDHDPALPRRTERQTTVGAELAVARLPLVGLAYATGEIERDPRVPEDALDVPEREVYERVTGALSYGGRRWHVVASSSFAESQALDRRDGDAAMMSYSLSLSLRPLDAVTVAPAVSVARERWSTVRGDTAAAALGLAYAPPRSRWFASGTLSYTTTRTSDGADDTQSVGAVAGVGCRLGRRVGTFSMLWLETGYGQYTDLVAPAGSSTTVWGTLSLKLAAF